MVRHQPSLCVLHDEGRCGSCPHLDTPPGDQLEAKQARVAALLRAHVPTGAWQPPCPSSPTHFRNKAKMVVAGTSRHPTLGILDAVGRGTDLRSCPLHVPAVRDALPVLADLVTGTGIAPYDVPGRRGELKHVLVTASPDEDLMVRFVLRSSRHVSDLRDALPDLRRRLPQLAVASVNIQPVHQAVIEGPDEIVLTEEDRLLMRLRLPPPGATAAQARPSGSDAPGGQARPHELLLHLPPRSFFQTNTAVAQTLYATARDWAEDIGPGGAAGQPPARVQDLFCGVGGFALALAGPGRRVQGVEVSEAAVSGARDSARLMRLDPGTVRFDSGDARALDLLEGPAAEGEGSHLLVVNPPRRGLGPDLARRIEACGVPRVLYSSCSPASLAADLGQMPSLRVRRARLFDMFPHTDHAEVLVELARTQASPDSG
ncbi:23S rRNA (uracil(747)-C(5))-methyltransferase [Actinomyces sp. 2119]|uniref:methyltransferase domain-containing protein n=1 Tax=Actinomyces sp. 2119 TaxID=2321393 RepID=UPI000E6D5320|nr:23S rRNA (uracil(747)-C(5))-methyltransferase [Actinomyces sp. 2119]